MHAAARIVSARTKRASGIAAASSPTRAPPLASPSTDDHVIIIFADESEDVVVSPDDARARVAVAVANATPGGDKSRVDASSGVAIASRGVM